MNLRTGKGQFDYINIYMDGFIIVTLQVSLKMIEARIISF